jgi:hypothetical protein
MENNRSEVAEMVWKHGTDSGAPTSKLQEYLNLPHSKRSGEWLNDFNLYVKNVVGLQVFVNRYVYIYT